MNKNEQVSALAEEIMIDITNNRLPLNNILLKASRLSMLIDSPAHVNYFKDSAVHAEQNLFIFESYDLNIGGAKDADISVSSANPNQYIVNPFGNFAERQRIKEEAQKATAILAQYRTETYNFALEVHAKWNFGNIARSIFERKRTRTESTLRSIFTDMNQRLNSIEQNIRSDNPESWKNAVVSCRTLLMDLADILNPPKNPEEKGKYINRLKDYISPLSSSKTKDKLLKTYMDELKKRIEYTSDLTQGSAHKSRPELSDAEDIVLYTYLVISELMSAYNKANSKVN